MKNRKLYAAALAATLAVSAFGTTVMAAETTANGTTTFKYTPGTAGPIDPVDPGTEETSENNWMVVYPKTIVLTDENVETADTFTKGAALKFTVKQKQAGVDGDAITEDNIPQGLVIEAEGANDTGDYTLTGASGTATMQLAGFEGTKITSTANEIGVLTYDEATQSGKAKISNNASAIEGTEYTTSVTFTFTNPGNIGG